MAIIISNEVKISQKDRRRYKKRRLPQAADGGRQPSPYTLERT